MILCLKVIVFSYPFSCSRVTMLTDATDPLLFNGKVAAACVLGVATAAASTVPWILPRIFTRHSVDAINVGGGRRPLVALRVLWQLTEVASHGVTTVIRVPCIYQVLVAAAAGVIFGAYLCHIAVDAQEAFRDYFAAQPSIDPDGKLINYPFAGMLAGVIFILLICVDKLFVESGIDGNPSSHGTAPHNHVAASMRDLEFNNAHMSAAPVGPRNSLDYGSNGTAESSESQLQNYLNMKIHGYVDYYIVVHENGRIHFN